MDFLPNFNEELPAKDIYEIKFGTTVQRIGKIFSYTFWRTKIDDEIFWSIQGNNTDGSAWIVTHYFGPKDEAKRYQQEIILHHPTEKKWKKVYMSLCTKGITISRKVVQDFKDEKNNTLQFEYRLISKKKQRMLLEI